MSCNHQRLLNLHGLFLQLALFQALREPLARALEREQGQGYRQVLALELAFQAQGLECTLAQVLACLLALVQGRILELELERIHQELG